MCVDGLKRYLRGILRPLAGSNSPRRVPASSTPPRVAICPPLCPLCSVAIVPDFPSLQLLSRPAAPTHLQQWTEKGINHIFEEDTLLFISLTPPAMGRQACPQSIDW